MERRSSFGSPCNCKCSSFRDLLRPRTSHSRSDSVHRFSCSFLPTKGRRYLLSEWAHSPQRVTGVELNEPAFPSESRPQSGHADMTELGHLRKFAGSKHASSASNWVDSVSESIGLRWLRAIRPANECRMSSRRRQPLCLVACDAEEQNRDRRRAFALQYLR